ncbi:aminoacyl-tRNA hydrolase [Candidatus Parcubacteria bacterium]|nr:aminoacyl-tRNA hydrolase [Candidatus Parcubacteria bacterium]
MILIIGLGNPGEKYKKTRHNVGFMVLDKLQETQGFSDWKLKKKFQAEISEGIIDSQKILLAKPQTFMNNSGKAVKAIINFLQLNTGENLLIIHDDLDLELGKIKIVKNRGHAGHKGVESIINEIKTKNFIRFRVGIKQKHPYRPVRRCEDFVLEKFNKKEEKIIKQVIDKTCKAIDVTIKNGTEKAMNKFNEFRN